MSGFRILRFVAHGYLLNVFTVVAHPLVVSQYQICSRIELTSFSPLYAAFYMLFIGIGTIHFQLGLALALLEVITCLAVLVF